MYNVDLANAILKRLDQLFPTPSRSRDLQEFQVKGFETEPIEKWLEAIDALLKHGLVDGTPLRNGQLLADVANLTITRTGHEEVAKVLKSGSGPKSKIVFLSHAAKDQEIALRLKQIIETAVPGSDVFVSSDTEDIRPGDEWVRTILDRLHAAGLLLILATERSIRRPWVWFETGAGWGNGLRAVPCCLGGTRKNDLPAPFSHYQGLNIDEEKDLRNLLREISREFELPSDESEVQIAVQELQRLDKFASASSFVALMPGTRLEPRVELEKLNRVATQENYRMTVKVKNKGTRRVSNFRIDVLFPTLFLKPDVHYIHAIPDQGTPTQTLFRANSTEFGVSELYPEDEMSLLTIDYSIDESIRVYRPGLLDQEIEVTLRCDDMEPSTIHRPVSESP